MITGQPHLAVLVCGDAQRRDDGVALRAVERLTGPIRAMVDLRFVGQLDPQALLDAGSPCVVVDAVVGVAPGTILCSPLAAVAEIGAAAPHSSHALPAAMVVGLAQAMGADVAGSRLVGVGIGDVRFGTALSAPVEAALPQFAATLAATIVDLAGAAPEAGRQAAPSAVGSGA